MLIFHTKKGLAGHLSSSNKTSGLGLVPTMGALHKGHESLVERAVAENGEVVVSIFVNPTQFNNKEDLKKYPKTLEADLLLLQKISEDIIIFIPKAEEMYDKEVRSNSYDFEGLDKEMEGAFRHNHFNGVGTIVEVLLHLTKPDRAYFGEKDFQQLQIIKKLVEIREIPTEIIGCPIVREASGLAMSSRNERLSKTLRQKASFIYKTLLAAKEIFGTKSANFTMTWVEERFKKHPYLQLEYFEITDVETLTPVKRKKNNLKHRAFIAVFVDGIRLIDNIAL